MAEAGQSVGGRKRTSRKTSLTDGETDRSVEEEAKLAQMARWRFVIAKEADRDYIAEQYFVLGRGGAALRAIGVRCISAVCEDQVGGIWHLRRKVDVHEGPAPLTEPLATFLEDWAKAVASQVPRSTFLEPRDQVVLCCSDGFLDDEGSTLRAGVAPS